MTNQLLVGIIMGSDSDLGVMKDAAGILKEFGVESEVKVLSAHRTPDQATEYAKNAEANGLKVIIAGAGGAAHLAGVTAGNTVLPVIGVPIFTKTMKGIDSLLSTAQMPPGIPVATVAINGAKNAGILAAQIIAEGSPELREKLRAYKKKMEKDVLAKTEKLRRNRVRKISGRQSMKKLSYKTAGVDIDTANETKREMVEILGGGNERVLNKVGAFASLFDGAFPEYKHPVLVLKTEEPGTKQKLALEHNSVETICYDLIGHLINDAIVMGAKPLSVQDCIVCGKMKKEVILKIVSSLSSACKEKRLCFDRRRDKRAAGSGRRGNLYSFSEYCWSSRKRKYY